MDLAAPIAVTERLSIPLEAIEERFLAASGPGGQNVNKVATAVQLRCDSMQIRLSEAARIRLARIAGRRMNGQGVILLAAQRFRTQEANRVEARERLAEMVRAALVFDPPRRPTRPTLGSKRRRVEGKVARSAVKRGRSKPDFE